MLRDNFWLDGKDARDFGIVLSKEIEFDGAEPVVESFKIPGSDRELNYYDGSYSNVRGVATCYILVEDAASRMTEINSWLMGQTGYRKLEVMHEPSFFRLARIVHAARMNHRINKLNGFEIEFDCDPYKYYKTGENATVVNGAYGIILNSPSPFVSYPLITVEGTSDGTITVNGETLTISGNCNNVVLDCRLRDAKKANANYNSHISGTYPKLFGQNTIEFGGGVSKLTILPRWRCL